MYFIAPLHAWCLLLFLAGAVANLSEVDAYVPIARSVLRPRQNFLKPPPRNPLLEYALRPGKGESRNLLREVVSRLAPLQIRAGEIITGSPNASRKLVLSKQFLRELFAEFIGTFIVVSLGTGSVMSDIFGGTLQGLFQVAAVWIIAVSLAISTTGHISGAHLNPSISIAFAMFRPCSQFGWSKVLPYVFAQTAGATLASFVNLVMYGPLIRVFEESHGIIRGTVESVASARAFGEYFLHPISTLGAFIAEAFGTAVLAFAIFALTHRCNGNEQKKVLVPPLIGACVGALIVLIAPLTQAGFNPARDFGPRIVAYLAGWGNIAFKGWWVYVLAPIVGAPIGAFIADKVLHSGVP